MADDTKLPSTSAGRPAVAKKRNLLSRGWKLVTAALDDAKKAASAARTPSYPRRELPPAPYPGTDLSDFRKSQREAAASLAATAYPAANASDVESIAGMWLTA